MKNIIRQKNKEIRNSMTKEEVVEKSNLASENFLKSDLYRNARCIMLYKSLGNETDTETIISSCFSDDKKVVLPVTERKSGKITPHYVEKSTEFEVGNFSVIEPKNAETANPADIDVIIVPGIAFDKKGNRVGFGKGCYDMFLPETNAVKVGFCYHFQLCDLIPSDKHDINMDYIITEKGIIKTK